MKPLLRTAAAVLTVCSSWVLTLGAQPAGAHVPLPAGRTAERPHMSPAALPVGNGDVIGSEPAVFYLVPLRAVKADASVERIMYRTGKPLVVTGTVLVPRSASPSRQMAEGTEYEAMPIKNLLDRGWAVVVTDYRGLGTPGVHTYMDREAQGRAVLDSLRAAQRLRGTQLPAAGPVGLYGYSQGGGAAASAAELAPTYAPELRIKGSSAARTVVLHYLILKLQVQNQVVNSAVPHGSGVAVEGPPAVRLALDLGRGFLDDAVADPAQGLHVRDQGFVVGAAPDLTSAQKPGPHPGVLDPGKVGVVVEAARGPCVQGTLAPPGLRVQRIRRQARKRDAGEIVATTDVRQVDAGAPRPPHIQAAIPGKDVGELVQRVDAGETGGVRLVHIPPIPA